MRRKSVLIKIHFYLTVPKIKQSDQPGPFFTPENSHYKNIMSILDTNKLSFNSKALEDTIKTEILVREILVYPKDIINYYIRKIHY